MQASDLRDVPLLTSSTAAAKCGLSPQRIIQLENEGKIHAIRDSAGRRLFLERDIERFLRERERMAEALAG